MPETKNVLKRIKRKKESWNHRGPTPAGGKKKKHNDELWHKDCRMLKKMINYCNMVSDIVYTTMVGKWMNE